MSTFDGFVTFDQDKVPVTVDLDPQKVSLDAGDTHIGEWSTSECLITDEGAGTFLIEAEGDKLSFEPQEPGRFAHSLEANGVPASEASTESNEVEPTDEVEAKHDDPDEELIVESPPPSANTVIAFYALAIITAALGIWAFVSLF